MPAELTNGDAHMNTNSQPRSIHDYEAAYSADYDFELVQVQYRREAVLNSLRSHEPSFVIEIGCGLEPLLPHYLATASNKLQSWVVVEPSPQFSESARKVALEDPRMSVIEDFFENVADDILAKNGPADMVICSGLLHEVSDQMALLNAIKKTMSPASVLHVNVPNSGSLHRRLAKAMGLIEHLEQMSNRNVQLQQHRVYSQETLRNDLAAAGLEVFKEGGILMKPFAHTQMQSVIEAIGSEIQPGLAILGEEFPALASEVYAEARLRAR